MMSPVVLEMLADARMQELQREVEQQRLAKDTGYRGPWAPLPISLTALLVAAIVGVVAIS